MVADECECTKQKGRDFSVLWAYALKGLGQLTMWGLLLGYSLVLASSLSNIPKRYHLRPDLSLPELSLA